MKDTRTILLGLLSVGLVATWVYHLYDKTKYTAAKTATEIKDPSSSIQTLQDSLQKVYASTVNNLGAQLDSVKSTTGLLQSELIAKLDEINRLKTEIAELLRKNNANKQDIDLAGKKTAKFQQLVSELPKKNASTPEQTKEISPPVIENNGAEIKPVILSSEKTTGSSIFTASDIRLTPIKITEDKEEETNLTESINKLVISFAVKNSTTDYNNAEVFAIITQPDGKVMQTDMWESASITTHDFGRKTYTRKVKFEYQKGETKHLQLTLKPEDYEKGNYRLQVFHNGYLIGETTKRLN
ncbi:MAG: hypothetical protein HOP10_12290 [Chitinophagaceae bacterium]|nr:hypothetical protein [Chitinophagaceae bacterium]